MLVVFAGTCIRARRGNSVFLMLTVRWKRGKVRMGNPGMWNTDALAMERERIERDLRNLEESRKALEIKRTKIIRRTQATTHDPESLGRIRIEAEQMDKAARLNDESIARTANRLTDLNVMIARQRRSDMV